MLEKVRPFGVFAWVISSVLFFMGNYTTYWVSNDNGHYGLWEHCAVTTTLKPNVTKVNVTMTTMPDVSSFGQDKNGDDDKEYGSDEDSSQEEDDCTPFNLSSLPAFFHIVRMITILASIIFAWGLLSGRTVRCKLERRPSFVQTHLAELLGVLAGMISYLGLKYFEAEYKTFKPDKFPNSNLFWSHRSVKSAIFLYYAAAIILMLPSFYTECKQGFQGFFPPWNECLTLKTLCIRIGLKKAPSPEISVAVNVRDTDNSAGVHDISFQMSETDSDSFTVTNNEAAIGLAHSDSDPPAYEDVALLNPVIAPSRYNEIIEPNQESGSEPAPPSYAEFMSGQYLAFNSVEPLAPPPPPPPPPYNSTSI